MSYSKERHREEAERFRDRIGDRLFFPDRVEPDKRHLIKDDIQRVRKILELPFGKRVLDVGCSDGAVTCEIAKKKACDEVIGVDISPSAIEEAKKRAKELEGKVMFLESFIEDLAFPSGYFDTISACETLEHIGEGQLEIAMKNLIRMLKIDGNMIITVPNRQPAEKYIKEKRDRWNWPTHYHFFTKESLTEFLKGYFRKIEFFSLYENEKPEESIYLIVNCRDGR